MNISKPKPRRRNPSAQREPNTQKIRRIARGNEANPARRRREDDHTDPATGIVTFTARELQKMEFPPIRYAVKGYIAEGLTILAGKPKIGKSWMALDFAMAIAEGNVALGSISCERGAVLYCALEDNQRRLQRRMRQRYGDESRWPQSFYLTLDLPRLNEGGIEVLEKWIHAYNPSLIIIDTFVAVRPRNNRANGYEADYESLAPLQELAGEKGISIIVVHHLRKMAGEDPLDMISGTTGLTGAVDAVLVLHRGSKGVTLYGRGRDVEEIEMAVEFNNGAWRILGEASKIHRSEERDAIINVLSEARKPLSPKAIADALNAEPNNIKQLLFKMSHDGEVHKKERGKYQLLEN